MTGTRESAETDVKRSALWIRGKIRWTNTSSVSSWACGPSPCGRAPRSFT